DDNNTTQAAEMPVDGSDNKKPENENHNNNVAAIVDSLLPAEPVTQKTEQPTTGEVVAAIISDAEQAESAIEPEQPLVGNAWYLSQPDDNFVIQLLAVTKQEISDKFINENGLQGQVNTYQSLRSGKPWWIVTYGSYATLNEAKKGVTTLSNNVRKNQPFYKKISKIKQEIASLNQ
ncbi:MAG: SPOR domain-containing protein, partial [Pseudomonadota bacterium]